MLLKRNVRATASSCGSAEEWRDRVSESSCSSSEAMEVSEWVVRDESVTRCCIASSSSMTVHDNFWIVEFMILPWILILWFLFDVVLLMERKQGVLCRGIYVFDCYSLLSFSLFQVGCRVLLRLGTEVVCTVINGFAAFSIWLLNLHVFYSISRYLLTPCVFFTYSYNIWGRKWKLWKLNEWFI